MKSTIYYKTLAALLLLGAGAAHAAKPPTLCQPGEKIVFTCGVQSKILSVCASSNFSTRAGTVQYRFGPQEQPELLFPNPPKSPNGVFWASSTLYSGGSESRIRMKNGDYDFLMFDAIIRTGFGAGGNKPEFTSGVVVKKKGKVASTRLCTTRADMNSELTQALPQEDFDDEGRP